MFNNKKQIDVIPDRYYNNNLGNPTQSFYPKYSHPGANDDFPNFSFNSSNKQFYTENYFNSYSYRKRYRYNYYKHQNYKHHRNHNFRSIRDYYHSNKSLFTETEYDQYPSTINNRSPIKAELIKLKLIFKNEAKEIILYQGDNHSLILNDFFNKNNISGNLAQPIIDKINNALAKIGLVLSMPLSSSDINCLELFEASLRNT